jgi:hypothetical protein
MIVQKISIGHLNLYIKEVEVTQVKFGRYKGKERGKGIHYTMH